ncbi:hypothetical protein D3C78_1787170 [compost metagenome]
MVKEINQGRATCGPRTNVKGKRHDGIISGLGHLLWQTGRHAALYPADIFQQVFRRLHWRDGLTWNNASRMANTLRPNPCCALIRG